MSKVPGLNFSGMRAYDLCVSAEVRHVENRRAYRVDGSAQDVQGTLGHYPR